jgi:hypothetical protein
MDTKKSTHISFSLCVIFIFTILLNTFLSLDYIHSIQTNRQINTYGTFVLPAILEEELENENDFLKSHLNENSFDFFSIFNGGFFVENIVCHSILFFDTKNNIKFCLHAVPLFLKNRIILI